MNDIVIKTGKTLDIGEMKLEITDEAKNIHFVDLITEARHYDGVIYVSLGAGILDGSEGGTCRVISRLRMSLGTAQILRQNLDELITAAMTPPIKGPIQ